MRGLEKKGSAPFDDSIVTNYCTSVLKGITSEKDPEETNMRPIRLTRQPFHSCHLSSTFCLVGAFLSSCAIAIMHAACNPFQLLNAAVFLLEARAIPVKSATVVLLRRF